ncbi:MAG: cytochrome c family protein [Desulfobacteraceae bacterium]|nr:cytochrome c family protein [Pseudomonadota bacterium]MBU4462783.1 cytochrome c family protein [Pseudomonadota bacterium]MCG2754058.1 cytochrome c family protein [Desulfobacteraceae bacterium]
MTPQKELQLAYGLAIILLVVGVLSYAAFPAKAPEQPVRLMFKCVAGKILFDHKTHTVESGYGISCSDCHHNLEEGETAPQSCGECHEPESQEEDMLSRSDAFHTQCIDCHKEAEAGPQKCASCHVM